MGNDYFSDIYATTSNPIRLQLLFDKDIKKKSLSFRDLPGYIKTELYNEEWRIIQKEEQEKITRAPSIDYYLSMEIFSDKHKLNLNEQNIEELLTLYYVKGKDQEFDGIIPCLALHFKKPPSNQSFFNERKIDYFYLRVKISSTSGTKEYVRDTKVTFNKPQVKYEICSLTFCRCGYPLNKRKIWNLVLQPALGPILVQIKDTKAVMILLQV